MSLKDIRIIPTKSGGVDFDIYRDKGEDSGFMLLQRLYVLLFNRSSEEYVEDAMSGGLLDLLDGVNTPPDGLVNSILSVACAVAVRSLDESDAALVNSFTGNCVDGVVTVTLQLQDGTELTGVINDG